MIGFQQHPARKINLKQHFQSSRWFLQKIQKVRRTKAPLDVCSNDMSFRKAATNCDSLFAWAEKLDRNLTIVLRHWSYAFTYHVLPLLISPQLLVTYFLLSFCWNGSLDLLCLGGFGIDDCIAVGIMPSVALGTIHSRESQQSHIWKEAV